MSRERIALDSLASLVIQWQNMFNKVIKEQEEADGRERYKVKIEDKETIINRALCENDDEYL
tara:strand:- start:700 stop:885 length:186 start_codon:yes stop_codon:yes gene_type:complete